MAKKGKRKAEEPVEPIVPVSPDEPTADDLLAAAVASGRTIKDAARVASMAPRTAYRHAEAPAFQQRVQHLRAEMVSRAAGSDGRWPASCRASGRCQDAAGAGYEAPGGSGDRDPPPRPGGGGRNQRKADIMTIRSRLNRLERQEAEQRPSHQVHRRGSVGLHRWGAFARGFRPGLARRRRQRVLADHDRARRQIPQWCSGHHQRGTGSNPEPPFSAPGTMTHYPSRSPRVPQSRTRERCVHRPSWRSRHLGRARFLAAPGRSDDRPRRHEHNAQ